MAVGYLFTDIEGSTQRWEASPARMAAAVARHDEILDASIAEYGGVIQDRAGDGVFALFPEGNPIACALAIQLAMTQRDWSAVNGLNVRVGVHAAKPVGANLIDRTAVNRAHRIVAAGWGGQIVISEAATTAYPLPDGAQLTDLGICHLKGIPEALRLFGLQHADLPPKEFPPLRTQFRSVGTIPLQASPLFGRARDITAVDAALVQTRLVTVVGPGGNGKTRMAVELGKHWESGQPVLFLSLRGVMGSTEMVSALGEALRFPFRDCVSQEQQLCEYLRDKRMLLILDNAEGIAGDAGFVAALVSSCPGLAVLATSREPLRVQGEGLYRLGGVSARSDGGDLSPAYEIFVHAARTKQPEFDLTEAQLPPFQELCACVGGSPLALRLMAQWVRFLSLDEILARVKVDLDFLGGAGAEEQHHRTLREVFEESWRRLDEKHRGALASLSVLEGAFDWALARDALGVPLDAFAALEQKGLIDPTFGRRFLLHPLIRSYAREKLASDANALQAAVVAHRTYFLNILCANMTMKGGRNHGALLEELREKLSDIRTAWLDALHTGDDTNVMRAIEPLCYFFCVTSMMREGAAWFNEFTRNEALALHMKGVRASFLVQQGDMTQAAVLGEEILRTSPAPPLARGHAHTALATVAHSRGDFQAALAHYEEALRIRTAGNDRVGMIYSMLSIAALHLRFGDSTNARVPLRDGLRISREIGLTFGLVSAHIIAGDIAIIENRTEDARLNFATGLELECTASSPQFRAHLLRRAGSLALRMGKRDDAEKHHTEALELFLDLGDQRAQAQAYIDLGEDSMAAEFFGEARERFMRGVRLAIAFASTHLRNLALLGLARAEIGLGNVENAARIAHILAGADVAQKEPAYATLVDTLGSRVSECAGCDLDDVLTAAANDADARALML